MFSLKNNISKYPRFCSKSLSLALLLQYHTSIFKKILPKEIFLFALISMIYEMTSVKFKFFKKQKASEDYTFRFYVNFLWSSSLDFFSIYYSFLLQETPDSGSFPRNKKTNLVFDVLFWHVFITEGNILVSFM